MTPPARRVAVRLTKQRLNEQPVPADPAGSAGGEFRRFAR